MDFSGFQTAPKHKSFTRRGMLSSVYDPLGLAAPLILEECIVMQRLCKQIRAWDEPLEEKSKNEWNFWENNLKILEVIRVALWFKQKCVSVIIGASAHHLSEAPEIEYAQASRLRLGQTHCSLLSGKSRVGPTKYVHTKVGSNSSHTVYKDITINAEET